MTEPSPDLVAEQEARALSDRRITLIGYLRMKTAEGDWHGVADAAMDLREIDAMLRVVRRI